MASEEPLEQALLDAEAWLRKECPLPDAGALGFDQERLKQNVRLAVQEAWLARRLRASDHTPDSLSSTISGQIKRQLATANSSTTPAFGSKSLWTVRYWIKPALAAAAMIGIIAAGAVLFKPSTSQGPVVRQDNLPDTGLLTTDIDTSLTALSADVDELSWSLQSLDSDLDGDIQTIYDQFDSLDVGNNDTGNAAIES